MNASDALSYGAGSGAMLLGLTALLRSLPGIVERAIVAWQRVATKRAQVDAHAAQADLKTIEGINETLADLRNRLDKCEERHGEAEKRAQAAEKTAALAEKAAHDAMNVARSLEAYVHRLTREMRRRGMTPPGMDAVSGGEDDAK